jgi:hypothetical protein
MSIAHHPSPTVGPPLLWMAFLALVAGGVLAWVGTRRPRRGGSGAPDRGVEWRGVAERSQGVAVLVGAAAVGADFGGG